MPERDRAELALLTAALERDLPVLAICRGSQVLNVALGGDLIQHLPDLVGHERHKRVAGQFSDHEVEIEPGSRLAGVLGDRARSSRTTIRATPGSARGCAPSRATPTGRSRRSRIRAPVHGRRALAPRGRRGPAPVRGARRRGAAYRAERAEPPVSRR